MPEIPRTKKIIMMLFNTQCDLCLSEMPLIRNNLEQIEKHYHLVFVSFESANSLMSFFEQYSMNDNRNISVISDKRSKMLKFCEIDSYPSLLLFNENRSLMRRGMEITIQTISELLSD